MPGQYIFADSSGPVVNPAAELDEVLAEARKVRDEDREYRRQIAQEP
jgi:regulator of RNase E activity RraA